VRSLPRLAPPTLVAALLFAAAPACSRTAGSKCKAGESLCADKKTALTCHDGTLHAVPCNGPLGCTKLKDRASCDTSLANEGDACMATGDEEYACSFDKKRALRCSADRRFARYLECRGRGGCSQLGRQVSCDTSVAARGDPCKSEGAVACTDDQKEMVICRDGKYAPYRFCRGQYGCARNGDTPQCDETLSLEGDPCGLPGYVVCSVDGQSELVCHGGSFMRSRSCRKSGCLVTNKPGRPTECD
jgi:hypothetical protein